MFFNKFNMYFISQNVPSKKYMYIIYFIEISEICHERDDKTLKILDGL